MTGRPQWKPTPEVINKVEGLAARGLTLGQIAHCLGISYETLRKKKKEHEEFAEAIRTGQARGLLEIANALFEKAKGGDTIAMIFFLKSRDPANWHERLILEQSGPGGGPIEHKYGNASDEDVAAAMRIVEKYGGRFRDKANGLG